MPDLRRRFGEIAMIIIELPLSDTVALVFDPEDTSNLETAIQYAHDGFIVVAVNDCKSFTGELQRALNHEQACFGREVHYV